MKISIDLRKCVGAGICVVEEPRIFRFLEGSKQAAVTHPEVPLALQAKLRGVARHCPNGAIIVEEDDGTVWQGED
jgi:ferredoxin